MRFDKYIKKILESNLSTNVFGSNSNIGTKGGSVGNEDFYAPGDSRVPKPLFTVKGSKKRKRINIMRRPRITGL